MIRTLTISLSAVVSVIGVVGSAAAQPRIIEIPAQPSVKPAPAPADKAAPPNRVVEDSQKRISDPRWAEGVARARDALAQVEKDAASLAKARAEYEKIKAQHEKKEATPDELNAAKAKYTEAETNLRRAVLESAQAEAHLQYLDQLLRPGSRGEPIEVIRPRPLQSKLPARNGFPNPQTDFGLAQVEFEVANLQLEGAKLELARLESSGADQAEIDAARARVEALKVTVSAAENKVLRTSKLLYGW